MIAYLSFASNTNPVDAKYNLARNEIALLIRLMLKKELTITFNESLINNNIERTVELLSNLHTSLNDEMWTDKFTELAKYIQNDKKSDIQNLNDSYPDFKEPVFYAGDYAYDFQYRDFAVERYRNDNYWIIDNKGFDVVSARNIIHALKKIYTKKIAKLLELVAISQREMDLVY